MNINKMTLEQIRKSGFSVLNKELGPLGMIKFLQQFESGIGDYSKDRHNWINNYNFSNIENELKKK